MEENERGFFNQKGNRYFIRIEATTNFNSGFKTKEQFKEWLKKQFTKHGLDWQVGFTWKYKDFNKIFNLVDKMGVEVK